MSTTITSLQDDNISHAMFIDLQIGGNVYYMSTAYKPYTIDSNLYNELGTFLSIGDFSDDLKQTEGDVTLSLSGIPSNQDYIAQMLDEPIKGGNVTIKRGFFNLANSEIQTDQVFTRYKGVITNFQIQDNAERVNNEETATITVITSSINTILKNKISGQRTNPEERKRLVPGDKIFDRVPDLFNTAFDFGAEYVGARGGAGGGNGGGGGGNRGRFRDAQER